MEQPTLSRRSFLGGALALTAATALPAMPLKSVPVIYGDGRHDDTAGLQAALDGKPFRCVDGGAYVVEHDGYIAISNGVFRISQTLHIRRPNVSIVSCSFHGRGIGNDFFAVHKSATGCAIIGNYLRRDLELTGGT